MLSTTAMVNRPRAYLVDTQPFPSHSVGRYHWQYLIEFGGHDYIICTIQDETKCPPAFYCALLHGLPVTGKEVVEFHGHGHVGQLLMAGNYGIVSHY